MEGWKWYAALSVFVVIMVAFYSVMNLGGAGAALIGGLVVISARVKR